MADEMINPPSESCYSFNMHRGILCDPVGGTWQPSDPNYDPGPPPPPRPPKEKKEQKKEGDTRRPNVSEVSRQPQHPRGRHRYQQQGERSNRGPNWLGEAIPGSSSGHTNGLERPSGDRAMTNGGRGRGSGYTGPVRQPYGRGRGGGKRMAKFDQCVRGLLRTLRLL